MCGVPEKTLGREGRKNKTISKKSRVVLISLESHLANCLQDAFQVNVSQEAAGFFGLNWKLQCFLPSLCYLTDESLTRPRALAGMRIWCVPLQGVLLLGLWSELSLCCWKEIFHLRRFKTEMVCSRLLPQDLSPLPFAQEEMNKSKWPAKLCFVSTEQTVTSHSYIHY